MESDLDSSGSLLFAEPEMLCEGILSLPELETFGTDKSEA
jgi:hypothetical protein